MARAASFDSSDKKREVQAMETSSEAVRKAKEAIAALERKAAANDSDSSDDKPAPKAKAKAKAAVSDSSSDDEPAPKAKAKATPKAAPKAADSDDSSDDAPAPKAKAKATPKAAPKAADSDDSSDDAPAPKAKAKAAPKAAAKAADSDSDSDEPVPKKAKTTPKATPKAAPKPDTSDDSSDDAAVPKAKAKAARKAADSDSDSDKPAPKAARKSSEVAPAKDARGDEERTIFVGGLPFSTEEAAVKKDFAQYGEIETFKMPLNDEGMPGAGKPKGIAFITYKTKEGAAAALKFDGEEYGGRRVKVNMAGSKPAKDKGEKGKGKGGDANELTAVLKSLPFSVEEAVLRKDFEECGEIVRLNLPKNDDGSIKGIAFVQYKTAEALEKALAFNATEYGGRTIYVNKASDKPAGDKGDGKGKDKGKDKGKGKGKDKGKDKGKGKGKDKDKGKKGSKNPARDGAIVESQGVKQTFGDDSDDDVAPPAKKAKTAPAAADSDSS